VHRNKYTRPWCFFWVEIELYPLPHHPYPRTDSKQHSHKKLTPLKHRCVASFRIAFGP